MVWCSRAQGMLYWVSFHVQVGIKGLQKGFSTLEDFDYFGAGNLKFSSISQRILELN